MRRLSSITGVPRKRAAAAALKRSGSIDSASTISQSSFTPSAVALENPSVLQQSMVTGNVHGGRFGSAWLKKPLFARDDAADSGFSSGAEAVQKLQEEALRRDPFQSDYADSLRDITTNLIPLIEQTPKFAWVTKQLMEPESFATFRVSWQDDGNNWRMNRGYRLLYSTALPPRSTQEEKSTLRLDHQLTHGSMRMLGFEQMFQSALNGHGSDAVFGADLNPRNRSPQELARFLQAFCASVNLPAQQFRMVDDAELCSDRAKFAVSLCEELAPLQGKRCMISGSGKQSFALAKHLCLHGAVPVCIADFTGYVHNSNGNAEEGMDLESILALEQQLALRSTSLYRELQQPSGLAACFYLNQRVHHKLAFTPTAPASPVDVVFLSESTSEFTEDDANRLVEKGAKIVVEMADRACTASAKRILSENGRVMFCPSKLVLSGSGHADARLRIAEVCTAAEQAGFDRLNLDAGATLAAFQKLAPMFKVPE